jgi:hypothetical protein
LFFREFLGDEEATYSAPGELSCELSSERLGSSIRFCRAVNVDLKPGCNWLTEVAGKRGGAERSFKASDQSAISRPPSLQTGTLTFKPVGGSRFESEDCVK